MLSNSSNVGTEGYDAERLADMVISQMLGHATVAFTMDVYTEVAEELSEAAAEAIAAFIPRRWQPGK